MTEKLKKKATIKTKEKLLEQLQVQSQMAGKTLTSRECGVVGISVKRLCKAYESYNNAVLAAGLSLNKRPAHEDSQNESMLVCYVDGSWDKNAPLSASEINHDPRLYSASVYSNIYGGMNGLRKAAGFEPLRVDRTRYQKEEVQNRLKIEVVKVGRPLKAKEINANPDLPSVTTILKSFGTTSLYIVWQKIGIA